jgi:hypothetical protein
LENAVVVGGLSALGAGLYSIGIPEDSILQKEVIPSSFVMGELLGTILIIRYYQKFQTRRSYEKGTDIVNILFFYGYEYFSSGTDR